MSTNEADLLATRVANLFEELFEAARSGDSGRAAACVSSLERGSDAGMVRGRDGMLRPAGAVIRELLRRDRWPSGFVPALVRARRWTVPETHAYAVVARVLNEHPELRSVETHVVNRTEISLYGPHFLDLRTHLGYLHADDGEAARAIYERCLANLFQFVDRVSGAAEAALAHDERAQRPREFDYRARTRAAVVRLATAFSVGDVPDSALAALAVKCEHACPTALFYDPKPANFIVHRAGDPTTAPTWKVDMDWMLVRAPVVHQAALVVFTYPIRPSNGSDATTYEKLHSLILDSVATRYGTSRPDLDAVLLYHLLRNVAAKLARAPREAAELARYLGFAAAGELDEAVRPVAELARRVAAELVSTEMA
jgi:hypothetical protein